MNHAPTKNAEHIMAEEEVVYPLTQQTNYPVEDLPPEILADTPEIPLGADISRPQGEEALPPEARGETNGGPLGCCLGVVAGLFVGAMIVLGIPLLLSHDGYLSFATLPILLVSVVVCLGAVVCGYFGWRIGKKVYREYEQPVVKDRRKQSRPRRVY